VGDLATLGDVAQAVARRHRLADLIPTIHEQALRITGGQTSVLLRLNPATRKFHGTSAAGLEQLDGEPWFLGPRAIAAIERAFEAQAPIFVRDDPEAAARLQSKAFVLAPLVSRDTRLGLLAIGVDADLKAGQRDELATVADLFTMALERARADRDSAQQKDLRELGSFLTRSVASALDLNASLEIYCDRARRVFSADRASVWLNDRRARSLEVVASSDIAEIAAHRRVPTDERDSTVVRVMRGARAEIVGTTGYGAPHVMVPLRGRRRALGTFELSGLRMEPGDDPAEMLERLEEVGRQLSAVVESVFLLEDILRSRRELESTFNSLADLVVVSDARLRLTHANQAFAARVGRRAADLIDHPLSEFFGADLVSWVDRLGPDVDGANTVESRELQDPVLGGTFLFTISPLVGRDDRRIGTVVVASDVTEQARLQAERVELRDRLTQSEKLAALGQFVAGIAHELNNPLQGVLGHIELLIQETGQIPLRAKRDLKLVYREAERAAKIVHNLLVFAGSRRITRRRLNVNHVVTRVLRLRGAAAAATSIEIVKHLDPNLPRVAGDALLLQQAVLNIVMNAEQALATIEGPRRLELRTRLAGRRKIEIQIADNGPGISPDVMPRLFEPFFTTKEVGQGTGLGLAIAYGIMQEHDGRLMAANRLEGGAVFTLELPYGSEAVQ
jgi:C4-dicarboxylate-specific signal transduction histidine kinase